MILPTVDLVQERLELLRQRIEGAGGSRHTTRILAVTKTFPIEIARTAVAAGLIELGENYAQELVRKAADFPVDGAPISSAPRWHMIGGLQRNKIKKLVGVVDVWQTVDRIELADEIAKRVQGATVYVQVNTTAERQKSGCSTADAPELVARCRDLGMNVVGLMTIGPTTGTDPRPAFATLRELAGRLGVAELSMGMSGDIEAAVGEGSTLVRVGSALFGPRPVPTE